MKFAVVAVCIMFVASAYGQGLSEMMAMSAMLGNRGSSSSSGSSNPFAALTGGSSASSSSNPLAALASSGGSSNPLAALTGGSGASNSNPMASLMGGGMGRMASGMMLGGAEMSNLMDFYTCGMMRLPYQMCFMMMHNNM